MGGAVGGARSAVQRRLADAGPARGVQPRPGAWFVAVIGFRLPLDGFVARVDINGIAICRDDTDRVDLMIEGDPATIAAVVFDRRPLADAVAADALRYTGSRALAERFVRLFPVAPRVPDPTVTG